MEVHLWKNVDFTGRSLSLGQLAGFDHLRLCEAQPLSAIKRLLLVSGYPDYPTTGRYYSPSSNGALHECEAEEANPVQRGNNGSLSPPGRPGKPLQSDPSQRL